MHCVPSARLPVVGGVGAGLNPGPRPSADSSCAFRDEILFTTRSYTLPALIHSSPVGRLAPFVGALQVPVAERLTIGELNGFLVRD